MSKGGSKTSTQKLPKWYEDAAQAQIAMAQQAAQLPYMPWMGPSVAAASPMQEAAWDAAGDWGRAFGMFDTPTAERMAAQGSYLPPVQEFGGMRGYSAFPAFLQQQAAMAEMYPGIMEQYYSLFPTAEAGAGYTPPAWAGGEGLVVPGEGEMTYADLLAALQADMGGDNSYNQWGP